MSYQRVLAADALQSTKISVACRPAPHIQARFGPGPPNHEPY
jgi:hypothetical protein